MHAQLDVELAELKRVETAHGTPMGQAGLPSPGQAAAASALSFAARAAVPLLAAWFVTSYKVWVAVVVATATGTLAVFGPWWMAMGITYGLRKVFRTHGV
ncbi:vacuolar iron transporter homolog 4-like [Phragmites australis]|uniref:vacuolar iron transporter homolog 4-like n=1 Tax=Phragmites australis TaxID=29695 RepID=UPI002D7989D1|nr:vacuolar iron transporter homolog 4-like [Phragmites australis]